MTDSGDFEDEMQYLQNVHNLAKNQAAFEEHMRQRPINMRSREDMMLHMITAHDLHPLSLQFYDESEHDSIPALRDKKRNWSGPNVPSLDHEDLVNWHEHEHTQGEFASDYPHTTLDNEHFHHE